MTIFLSSLFFLYKKIKFHFNYFLFKNYPEEERKKIYKRFSCIKRILFFIDDSLFLRYFQSFLTQD